MEGLAHATGDHGEHPLPRAGQEGETARALAGAPVLGARESVWAACKRQHRLPGMACSVPAWGIMTAVYLQAMLTSLVIFGFAALEPILLERGLYHSRCPPGTAEEATCPAQLEAVNLLFVVNSSVTLVAGLIVNGWIMDLYGIKIASIVANVFMVVSFSILAATAGGSIGEEGWLVGFTLFGAAIGQLDCLFHFANLFPGNESLIIGSISGFSDSSALVFLIFATLVRAGVDLSHVFIGYTCTALLANLLFAVFLWPWWPVPDTSTAEALQDTPGACAAGDLPQRVGAEGEQLGGEEEGTPPANSATAVPLPDSEHSGADAAEQGTAPSPEPAASQWPLAALPIRQQLCTPLFLAWLVYCATSLLRFNFYIAALNEHLSFLGDSSGVYSEVFGGLASAGLVFVLAVGQIMDRLGLHSAVLLATIVGCALSAITLIPSLPLQVLGFLLAVLYRGFVFTLYAAVLIPEFGVGAYGRLSGVVAVVAGGLSFVQQPLVEMSLRRFDGDFTVSNSIMAVITASHFAFAWYYWRHRQAAGLDGTHPLFLVSCLPCRGKGGAELSEKGGDRSEPEDVEEEAVSDGVSEDVSGEEDEAVSDGTEDDDEEDVVQVDGVEVQALEEHPQVVSAASGEERGADSAPEPASPPAAPAPQEETLSEGS